METTKNCVAVINATFKINDNVRHLSFYIIKNKKDYNEEVDSKYNSVMSVCKMLNAVSIASVKYNTLHVIAPNVYCVRDIDEKVLKKAYDVIMKDTVTNVVV